MRAAERLLQKFHSESETENHSPQVQKVFAEWEQDRTMARERHETGKEPPNRPLEARDAPDRSKQTNRPAREKEKGIDIPF